MTQALRLALITTLYAAFAFPVLILCFTFTLPFVASSLPVILLASAMIACGIGFFFAAGE